MNGTMFYDPCSGKVFIAEKLAIKWFIREINTGGERLTIYEFFRRFYEFVGLDISSTILTTVFSTKRYADVIDEEYFTTLRETSEGVLPVCEIRFYIYERVW